ncbi:MAG: nucleotide pyrophosphohydrolase [Candidatus Sericytochromatia bacterium]|nr:nucleotide pyrophosphohydrolase [Candidatus Sericytochromatia bacterium]
MNISDLEKEIIAFRDLRNWKQFHTVKDLLLGLNIEVSELSELFLWKNELEIADVDRHAIADELADIFVFLSYLAQHFEIDLAQAVVQKLHKNNLKYPLEKSYNSNKKYNQFESHE